MPQETTSHLAAEWLIIVNPTAGSGLAGKTWPDLLEQLASHLPHHRVTFSTHRGHATELAREAVEEGRRYLLAVGGDGTHHEVVNGIMRQQACPSTDVHYALLPVGTGNDWIKTHGIPTRFVDWLRMLQKGHWAYQNLGRLTYFHQGRPAERYFTNVAGLAYDGYVVRFTEGRRPRFSGQLFYLSVILRCLFQYRPQRAKLHLNAQAVTDRFYTINAGIGRYSGGGMQLVPHAEPAGNALAITYAGPVTRLDVLLNTYRFYNGTLHRHRLVTSTFTDHLRVEADGDGPLLLEADGEFLGETPVDIRLVPNALRFLAAGPASQ